MSFSRQLFSVGLEGNTGGVHHVSNLSRESLAHMSRAPWYHQRIRARWIPRTSAQLREGGLEPGAVRDSWCPETTLDTAAKIFTVKKGAPMGKRAVFTVTAGLFCSASLFYSNQARGDNRESVFSEALQAYRTSDYAKALEKGREALELAKKSNNKQAVEDIILHLGQVYSSLSQYEKALGYYEQALVVSRVIGDRNGAGAALEHIGTVYWVFARYEEALGYYEESLTIRQETGDRKGVGTTLINIGLAYSRAWPI